MKTAEEVAEEIVRECYPWDRPSQIKIIAQALTAFRDEAYPFLDDTAAYKKGCAEGIREGRIDGIHEGRNQALEEAAKVVQEGDHPFSTITIAERIRALKDKP